MIWLLTAWICGWGPAGAVIRVIDEHRPCGCESTGCPRMFAAAILWPIGIPVMLIQLYRRRRRPALPRAVVR